MPRFRESRTPWSTEELSLGHLGSGQLGQLSILGLDMHTTTSMMDPTVSNHLRAVASEEVAFGTTKECGPCQSREGHQPAVARLNLLVLFRVVFV